MDWKHRNIGLGGRGDYRISSWACIFPIEAAVSPQVLHAIVSLYTEIPDWTEHILSKNRISFWVLNDSKSSQKCLRLSDQDKQN